MNNLKEREAYVVMDHEEVCLNDNCIFYSTLEEVQRGHENGDFNVDDGYTRLVKIIVSEEWLLEKNSLKLTKMPFKKKS